MSSNHLMSFGMVLGALGRFDEAKGMLDKAEARDPLSPCQTGAGARTAPREGLRRGHSARAATTGQFWNDATAPSWAGTSRARPVRRGDSGIRAGRQGTSRLAPALRRRWHAPAESSEARTRLRELEATAKTAFDATSLAGVYVSLNERTRALDALERAYAGKQFWLPLINVEPAFSELHGDERFEDLLRRVGIPPGR